jgi:predicted aspartyl protease
MDGAAQSCNPAARWPLTFDAGGEVLHCPMVEVTIGGYRTKLIVDTGATAHVLTMELVDRAGLEAVAAPPGRDAAGAEVPSWAIGRVAATIAGSDVTLRDVAAIDGPPPFRAWGVGGFLSPQALANRRTALLDLRAHTLEFFDREPTELLSDLMNRFGDCELVHGVRHTAGTLGVDVAVAGARPAIAIFDTGAAGSDVAASIFPKTIEGTEHTSGRGIGGSAISARTLEMQPLKVGHLRLTVPVLSVRDEIPVPHNADRTEVPEALIGMDLLRATALAITPPGDGAVWWFVGGREDAGTDPPLGTED